MMNIDVPANHGRHVDKTFEFNGQNIDIAVSAGGSKRDHDLAHFENCSKNILKKDAARDRLRKKLEARKKA